MVNICACFITSPRLLYAGICQDIDFEIEEGRIVPEKTQICLKQKKKILSFIDAHPNFSLKTIQKRYPAFKQPHYKKRWSYQISCGGSEKEILEAIENYTLEHFKEARLLLKPVHDVDIQRWGIEKSLDFR